MASCKNKDKREFYKLVKKQRSAGHPSGNIFFGELEEPNSVPDSFANYFKNLATPSDSTDFDKEHNSHLDIMQLLHA